MSIVFVIIQFFILTWRAYANYAEWLFSLRKRLRRDTFAIFCYSTDYADYAADLAYTTLYMKHTNYADYADKTNLHVTMRDYARLRPAGPRLREHSCSFMAIIAPSCRKKRCSCGDYNVPLKDSYRDCVERLHLAQGGWRYWYTTGV